MRISPIRFDIYRHRFLVKRRLKYYRMVGIRHDSPAFDNED